MAECSESEMTVDGDGSDDSNTAINVDISDWTNNQDSESQAKRYRIIHAILHNLEITDNQSRDDLRTILNSGWDVNEIFVQDLRWLKVYKTALHLAARQGCTEAVKMLLEAGAKCKSSDVLQNPLVDAVGNSSTDVVKLLLKHGAHPNDHDGEIQNVVLIQTLRNCKDNVIECVQLQLEHGADPNVTTKPNGERYWALREAFSNAPNDVAFALMKSLVYFGADVNLNIDGEEPLLHTIIGRYTDPPGSDFLVHDQLDFFFLHGGNISVEVYNARRKSYKTALEDIVRTADQKNKIRWLIRHGADTSNIEVYMFKYYFTVRIHSRHFPETALLLLQVDMRFPHEVKRQLSDVATAISARLEGDMQIDDMYIPIHGMRKLLEKLEKDKDEELQRMLDSPRKCNFPEYWTQQMVDLQEFSDESLQVYPDYDHVDDAEKKEVWQDNLYHMNRVLSFLSQTQSLQWHCRRCVRENLVSLQPSVVKSLLIPAILKRYILCHEI